MAQDKSARRAFATKPSAPPAPALVVLALPAPQHLNGANKAAAAVSSLGTARRATAGKDRNARTLPAKRRPEKPPADESAKRRKTLPPKDAPETAQQSTEPKTKKQRHSVVGVAPPACGEMSRDKFVRRVVATKPSALPLPECACRGFDVKIREDFAVFEKPIVASSSPSGRLKQRMEAELDALGSLVKKAELLSRGTGRSGVPPAGKDDARIVAAKRQREVPSVEATNKVGKNTVSKPTSEVTKPNTEAKKQQQQPAVQRDATRTTKESMASHIDKAKEVMERQRLEEIARAREEFRQYLIKLEKEAMPDETIYPEELLELGITDQYAVTPTLKQLALARRR